MKIIISVTENIELRTLELSDAKDFFELTKRNDTHLRQWLGWLDDDKTVLDTEKYIIESNKRFENEDGLDLGIFYDNNQIGGIGLFPWDTANKKISLSYWLAEDYQGKGIMTDCLMKVINYIFTEMNINRIEITVATDNIKSSALPKKLGFTLEGVAREGGWLYDHFVNLEVYSLLAKEYKK